jgi:hypothetical protein
LIRLFTDEAVMIRPQTNVDRPALNETGFDQIAAAQALRPRLPFPSP